jgi:seryl-tRNA synthetase
MHDIKAIRDNPTAFDAGLKRRGLGALSPSLLAIDERRRAAILASEQAQARRNAASKEIGDAKKAKDEARAAKLMAEVAELKTTMPELEAAAKTADDELTRELSSIPNLPLDEVPDGTDEHGNVQHHVFGKARDYGFAPKLHDDLGTALGTMDFEAAAKLSGARFVVLKKGLARLERAIGQFMLDLHTGEHGYTEINPPLLVRDAVMFGTGQLPKFEDDQFWAIKGELLATPNADLRSERLGLIPTAEVSLTNLARESILDEKELPMRLTALTPCFRARDLELLSVRRLPGPPHGCALPRSRRQAALRAYAERLRHGGRPRLDRGHGDLPAAGWLDRGTRCAAALYGRAQGHRARHVERGPVRCRSTVTSTGLVDNGPSPAMVCN